MSGALWFALGAVTATVVVTRIKKADSSTCCLRVAYGARDKLAGYTGPFSDFTSGLLDNLGLTKHLPGILDSLGVPLNA